MRGLTAFLFQVSTELISIPYSVVDATHYTHCKMRSMKFIQNYHNEHTKFKFSMLIVVILYDLHTSHFAVLVQEEMDKLNVTS